MFCASPLWLGEKSALKSKYEKCQDITTEIYKRINITFAIKNLESKALVSDGTNDNSDHIDSNELSNATDLFAYDKTDSLSSSVTLDDCFKSPQRKVINLNNNEETVKKPSERVRRPKKRFRKRVKKKLARKHSDTDCSSDEEPLSRIVVDCKKRNDAKRNKFDKRTATSGDACFSPRKNCTISNQISGASTTACENKLNYTTGTATAKTTVDAEYPDDASAGKKDEKANFAISVSAGKSAEEINSTSGMAVAKSAEQAKPIESITGSVEVNKAKEINAGSERDNKAKEINAGSVEESESTERNMVAERVVAECKRNPVEEAVSEQMAREYEFFSRVMAEAGERPDLDAVLMPALYPQVDLHERRLGLPGDDVTYYTFADLVTAGPRASPAKSSQHDFAVARNRGQIHETRRKQKEIADKEKPGDSLIKNTSEHTTKSHDDRSTSVSLQTGTNTNLETTEILNAARSEDLEPGLPVNLSVLKEEDVRNAVERTEGVRERVECGRCKLTFSGVRGLRRHARGRCAALGSGGARGRSARGERAHRCHTCDKSFARRDTWKRHQRLHAATADPATTRGTK